MNISPITQNEAHHNIVQNNATFLKDKLFLEFGVWVGTSIREFVTAYQKFIPNYQKKFYGFDSFEGLPEEVLDKNHPPYWKKGDFNLNGIVPTELMAEHFHMTKGWFQDSLTQSVVDLFKNEKIGLLHVDSDIYTSSYQALDFCFKYDLITKGTIIVYDDWGAYHEKSVGEFEVAQGRAHTEIMEKYKRTSKFKNKYIITPGYHEISMFELE